MKTTTNIRENGVTNPSFTNHLCRLFEKDLSVYLLTGHVPYFPQRMNFQKSPSADFL